MTEAPFSLNKKLFRAERWDFYAYLWLSVVVLFQAAGWHRFPLFIDCYYHLSVTQGFVHAGGWVGESFWEFAPVGRPHLYPPLFHLLELLLFRCGIGLIGIARFFELLVYPLFLLGFWYALRRLFSASLAFFSLFLLSSSYSFYVACINNIPFSLAFLFGFLAFYFLERKLPVASCVCLILSFYSHNLAPWFFMLAMRLYVFRDRSRQGVFNKISLAAFIAAAPFFFHELRYLSFVRFARSLDFYYLSISPLIIILGLVGVARVLREKGSYRFMLFLLVSISFMFFTHRHRLFSGQGFVVFSFFAAVMLDECWRTFFVQRPIFAKLCFWTGCLIVFHVFSLWFFISPLHGENRFLLGDSPLAHWMGWLPSAAGPKDTTVYSKKLMDATVKEIRVRSDDRDILFFNYSYGGGMLAVLADRTTSGAMLGEVKPFKDFDPISVARLVLWFKEPDGSFPKELPGIIKKYGLKAAKETSLIYISVNEKVREKSRVIPARVPSWLCFTIIFGLLAAMAAENLMKKASGSLMPPAKI